MVWCCMKRRCYCKKDNRYNRYGGRGITVCKEWLDSFKSFYKWAVENGWENGLHIDRINNNEEYGPHNCRFVTRKESMRNQGHSKYWIINGKSFDSVRLASKHFCVSNATIRSWCNGRKDENRKHTLGKTECFSICKY